MDENPFGILNHAGIPGFLENRNEVYKNMAQNRWAELVDVWYKAFGTQPVKASQLYELAEGIEDFPLPQGKSERAVKTTFGLWLTKHRDQIFGNLQIKENGTFRRATLWSLEVLNENQCEPVNVCEPLQSSGI
jgi:hypothetical protein